MTEQPKESKRVKDVGFWRELWQQAQLVYYLLRDPEVPFYLKFLPAATFAYLIFPFDFVPDMLPALGQLDDLGVILVGAKMFIDLTPPHIVARHLEALQNQDRVIIDGKAEDVSDKELDESIIIESDPQTAVKKNGSG